MTREFLAAGVWGVIGLLVAPGHLRADDLVTLSGATYHDVRAVRVEPDGVTWRYDSGAVKVDFADCPENVRRAYHYDPAKATAFRDAQTKARQQADEQAQHDAKERETRQRARAQAAMAQMSTTDGNASMVFRRALSPAASNATREMAAQMQAEADKRAAAATANPDQLNLIPALPGALGPRPTNRFMDTPNSKEFAASLHTSPTGAGDQLIPAAGLRNTSIQDGFFTPMYATRSYYEDTERAEAFARGVPPK